MNNSNIANEDCFPYIPKVFRVSWQPNGARIVNLNNGALYDYSYLQSIVLSLCNGHFSYSEICLSIEKHFGVDCASTKIFDAFKDVISWKTIRSEQCIIHEDIKVLNSNLGNSEGFAKHRFPTSIVIVLMDKCNFKCNYCIRDLNFSSKRRELSYSSVKKVIREASKNNVLKITFTGGEPLLDKNIFDYVRTCLGFGIFPSISTNGYLLTKKAVNEFLSSGLEYIQVSLDTVNPEVFQIITRSRKIERVLKNIKDAVQLGMKVNIRTVLTMYNYREINALVDYVESIGIKSMDITPATYFGHQNDKLPSIRTDLLDLATRKFKNKKGINVNVSNIDKNWKNKNDIVRCGGVISDSIIFPNGDIGFCANLPSLSYGNILTGTILDAWNSKHFSSLRLRFNPSQLTNPTCLKCESSKICMGGCPAMKLGHGIDFNNIDPRCYKRGE
ncbi:MAG: radical SAM protein [Vibrionaceae bacterium]|nr:radical SAM protein [Vibrionaceae bacterium]